MFALAQAAKQRGPTAAGSSQPKHQSAAQGDILETADKIAKKRTAEAKDKEITATDAAAAAAEKDALAAMISVEVESAKRADHFKQMKEKKMKERADEMNRTLNSTLVVKIPAPETAGLPTAAKDRNLSGKAGPDPVATTKLPSPLASRDSSVAGPTAKGPTPESTGGGGGGIGGMLAMLKAAKQQEEAAAGTGDRTPGPGGGAGGAESNDGAGPASPGTPTKAAGRAAAAIPPVSGGILGLLRRKSNAGSVASTTSVGSRVGSFKASWAKVRKETNKQVAAKTFARAFAPALLAEEETAGGPEKLAKGAPATNLSDPGQFKRSTTPRPSKLDSVRKPVRPIPKFMIVSALPSLPGCQGVPKNRHEDVAWLAAHKARRRSRVSEKIAMRRSGVEGVVSESEDESGDEAIRDAIYRLKGTSVNFEEENLQEEMYHIDRASDDDEAEEVERQMTSAVQPRSMWRTAEDGTMVKITDEERAAMAKQTSDAIAREAALAVEREKEDELRRLREKEQARPENFVGRGTFNQRLRAAEQAEKERHRQMEEKVRDAHQRENPALQSRLSQGKNMSKLDQEDYEKILDEYKVDYDRLFSNIERDIARIPDLKLESHQLNEDTKSMDFSRQTADIEGDLQVLLPFVKKIQAYFRGRLGRKKARVEKKIKEKRTTEISARLDRLKIQPATIDMAYRLNIDPFKHPQLLWVAQLAQLEEMPEGWKVVTTVDGDQEFANDSLEMRTFEHPVITKYRNMLKTLKVEAAIKIQKVGRAFNARKLVEKRRMQRVLEMNYTWEDEKKELEKIQNDKAKAQGDVPSFVLDIVRGLVNERLGGKIPLLPP